jgi:hypothetical protein
VGGFCFLVCDFIVSVQCLGTSALTVDVPQQPVAELKTINNDEACCTLVCPTRTNYKVLHVSSLCIVVA